MFGLTQEEVEELMICLIIRRKHRRRRKKRQLWIHPLMSERLTSGHYYNLMPGLRNDNKEFFDYFRMSPNTFDSLLSLLEVHIVKQESYMRPSIPTEEKLVLTF